MEKQMSKLLTSQELVRVCDLAIRRMVDYNVSAYSEKDQKLYQKIRDIKHNYSGKYGGML